MGRSPCCTKVGLNRGSWSQLEDKLLEDYIKTNGDGNWRKLPKLAGLKRCGRSCRLRWLNYLRPDIKRGNISQDEEDLIIRLHKLLGNRWSLIAGRLPGRTDNEIKNYWNTVLKKRKTSNQTSTLSPLQPNRPCLISNATTKLEAVETKANRCTKVFVSSNPTPLEALTSTIPQDLKSTIEVQKHDQNLWNAHFTLGNSQLGVEWESYFNQDMGFMEPFNEDIMSKDWNFHVACDLEENDSVDFESLAFWLDFKEA